MIFKPQQNCIGLDISDRSLKAVQLKLNLKNSLEIQGLSKIDLSPTVFDEGEIKQSEILTQAITELLANPEFWIWDFFCF